MGEFNRQLQHQTGPVDAGGASPVYQVPWGPQPVGGAAGGSFGAAVMPGSGGGGIASPGISVGAQTNPALDALLGRQNANLDRLTSGGGELMDTAAGRIRDVREGGRNSLMQSEGMRGVGSSNSLAGYEADTARGEQGAITDVANNRQQNLTNAIQGGLGIAGAGAQQALAEKQFGLSTYNAQQQAASNDFSHFMALLQAQRSSPIYSGTTTSQPSYMSQGAGGAFGLG